jgi:hypothetical protein
MTRCRLGNRVLYGALVASLGAAALAMSATPAMATSFVHPSSQKVALIPGPGPQPPDGPRGIMPTSSYVFGDPSESFDGFQFDDMAISQITAANLARYDTVALIQVNVSSLSSAQQAALAQFAAGGGKLLIHDADETSGNDYSWLLPGGSYGTHVGQGCVNCGSNSGTSTVIANSDLLSTNPADPSYVDFNALNEFTDAIGDSNLLVSTDPRWIALTKGSDASNDSGSQLAYAGDNNGLIIYNGYDTDAIKALASNPFLCDVKKTNYECLPPPAAQPTVDYLAKMWYAELAQGWGTPGQTGGGTGSAGGTGGGGAGGLPHPKRVVDIGQPLGAAAGLPSNRACVARRSILVHLERLAHVRHKQIVEADVYLNRRRVLHERRPFTNKRIKNLPRHGRYTVKVVATTRRGYNLIAKKGYRAC